MMKKGSQQNRFLRIITTPFRVLGKARDFYVRNMMDCANMNSVGLQKTSQAPGLPRSFSVASSRSNDEEDYRELVRAASARSLGDKIYLDAREKMRAHSVGGQRPPLPQRSISVAMGRIDEESPSSYLGEDINGNIIINSKNELKYPRSKSHAVARTAY